MSILKQIYKLIIVLSLIYIGWYIFAVITKSNGLLWKMMDIFGASTVTFIMVIIPSLLILLSLGNLKWIPQAKNNGKNGEVAFLTLGYFIAAAYLVTFVTSFI